MCNHGLVPVALDATYSLGRNLSGVGVYSREILFGVAKAHPDERFLFYYRPHRILRALREPLPKNTARRILYGAPSAPVFHALNQRVDRAARRTVSTFHDLFVMTGEYSSPEFRARFTEQARSAAERSDLIIAVSRFTARQVQDLLGVEPARIRVIPHGVHIPPPSEQARENLVLTVGAIQKRKNIARLVQAFERMPSGWRLAIAGAADGYGAAKELEAVERSFRRADIDVLGYVPAAQLHALYNRASIFAFPSLDEGFGIPVLESMAHGVPVIASNRSGVPEAAGDAALPADPEDVEAWSHALLRLAAEAPLRADLAQRGRERAAQFSWEAAVERTWAVYDELV
ncbi:MAG TPA: glycosyltransferase family 1 protein [Bryobacteraceae bacterium]|nr:glycosyltransferase family 1 protein [Bryobacteraceae bacterium]